VRFGKRGSEINHQVHDEEKEKEERGLVRRQKTLKEIRAGLFDEKCLKKRSVI